MSECPRSLSNQTKIRIHTSLRKLWGERLKWKRSREKYFQSWAESIANAAKVGGSDQEELEWDSYDKIKREIALEQLQLAAEKAKAKEMARIRAERAAQRKTEKMDRLVQRRKEREEKFRKEVHTKTVSLADQIRSAKKRTEDVNGKAFSIASSGSSQSIEVSAEVRFFTVETE
ncbi:hypothetical protein RND71_004624 [Anisodus tanguticus]|uniref:Uncharacterized protein n=1 Tax=Anisodus tanguticus TaxID=243964 RepID=A0AAE1SPY3_9SOLA|nr:hypothetical protein RND71_004624 [Anisodus tanguticus]